MPSQLKEFKPNQKLSKFIDSFWFFRNKLGKEINFPVVPDGCSDIIFYLNDSKGLDGINDTFVTGIMEQAQLIPVSEEMEFFGIRFKPGILFYLLEINMGKLSNNMLELSVLNKKVYQKLKIRVFASNQEIVKSIESQLEHIFKQYKFDDNTFLNIVTDLIDNSNSTIEVLSTKYDFSIKKLERIFSTRVGITPKKFARIMRFQKAHKKISQDGLKDLVTVALSAGYFDQAHFNRDYKKLTGNTPNDETMSILYNK